MPQAATVDLRGEPSHGVVARGKHLLHRIGRVDAAHPPQDGGDVAHLPARVSGGASPAFKARAVVGTADVETVGFDLAEIEVVPTARRGAARRLPRPRPARRRLGPRRGGAAARAPTPRAVHVALQDQRNIAGFGNEYANEILFVRGILPTTPANETDAAAIVDLGARMIRANRDRVDRTFTGDTRPGRTTWVYGREGRPCRRCGTLDPRRMRSAPTRRASASSSGAPPASADPGQGVRKRPGSRHRDLSVTGPSGRGWEHRPPWK